MENSEVAAFAQEALAQIRGVIRDLSDLQRERAKDVTSLAVAATELRMVTEQVRDIRVEQERQQQAQLPIQLHLATIAEQLKVLTEKVNALEMRKVLKLPELPGWLWKVVGLAAIGVSIVAVRWIDTHAALAEAILRALAGDLL